MILRLSMPTRRNQPESDVDGAARQPMSMSRRDARRRDDHAAGADIIDGAIFVHHLRDRR